MAAHPEDYEDVSVYTLDDDDEAELLAAQRECTFMWATKDGWPVGVIMSYIFSEGRFWLTCTSHRKRVAAVRRDPRVSVCVSSGGSGIRRARTVTYKGTCAIHDDAGDQGVVLPRPGRGHLPDRREDAGLLHEVPGLSGSARLRGPAV